MSKIALVTGGTRGIGAKISQVLKDSGYTTIANYNKSAETAKNFTDNTGIKTIKWDVSNFDECKDGIAKIKQEFGDIDVLVNNAGITRDGFLHKVSPDMWNDVISTNLSSCFNMVSNVICPMREREYGRIINISSINGLKGQAGQVNYSAAKAGVIGFTKALALESANRGITVNAIAPGYTDTEMVRKVSPEILDNIIKQIPAGRLALTDEIARAVSFLADEKSGYITGETISLNGGQYMY